MRKGRGEGDAVSQLQLLDPPEVTMVLSGTVSEKKTSISVKKSQIFHTPVSLMPPPLIGFPSEFFNTSYSFLPSICRYEIILQHL